MAFAIGGAVGLGWIGARGAWRELAQPLPVWIHGVGGLFGYHFFYFSALRSAPPAEAGLINYFWPLLIVLLSAALPGESLRRGHVLGAAMGLAGTGLLFVGAGSLALSPDYVPGYFAAALAAVIWATYSVTARFFRAVPSGAVAGFCLATALLSLLAHLALEDTVWPPDAPAWVAVATLGVLPLGVAFYVWDYGTKHGDLQLLGAASYAAPLLSTSLLVVAGYSEPRWGLAAGALLIAGGGLVAALASRARRRPIIGADGPGA